MSRSPPDVAPTGATADELAAQLAALQAELAAIKTDTAVKVASLEDTIIRAVQEHADAARVELTFDLRCRDTDDVEFVIVRGMDCWIERGSLTDPNAADPLEITISLDTDVYSPVTWGQERDNRSLAAHKASLFNQFLLAVRERTGASAGPVHAEDYAGQIGPDGFKVR